MNKLRTVLLLAPSVTGRTSDIRLNLEALSVTMAMSVCDLDKQVEPEESKRHRLPLPRVEDPARSSLRRWEGLDFTTLCGSAHPLMLLSADRVLVRPMIAVLTRLMVDNLDFVTNVCVTAIPLTVVFARPWVGQMSMHTTTGGDSGLYVSFGTLDVADLWRAHRSGWGFTFDLQADRVAAGEKLSKWLPPHPVELCNFITFRGEPGAATCVEVAIALTRSTVAPTMVQVSTTGLTLVGNRDSIAMMLRFLDTSEPGPYPPPPPPAPTPSATQVRVCAWVLCGRDKRDQRSMRGSWCASFIAAGGCAPPVTPAS